MLGPFAERAAQEDKQLQTLLAKAGWPLRASAFTAAHWLTTGIAATWGLVMGGLVGAILPPAVPLGPRVVVAILVALVLGGLTYVFTPIVLRNSITERGKEIDENLPHALNYMLALANAGMTPRDIWASLGRAKVFGAMAEESTRIARDLDLFGLDLLSALRNAQERTASKRFAEFLQGAISAFQSGVELDSYLRNKGEQYQREANDAQLRDIDTMGLMAEAFLVVVVAAPLFLIILLTVMSINQGRSVLAYGYGMVLVFIPLTQVIIGTLVRSLNPRVWT